MPLALDDDSPSPARTASPAARLSLSSSDHHRHPSAASRAPRPTPPGARRLSSAAAAPREPPSSSPPSFSFSIRSLFADLVSVATALLQQLVRLYLTLTPPQRALVVIAGAAALALSVVFLVLSHRIFAWLGPLAAGWRAHPAGWPLVWLATFATAFPPVIGYSTCVTVAGFVYGFPWGWPLAASATVAGSAAAFLTSRGVFAGYVQRLVGKDRRFVALGQVLRRDGLGVLVMIRLCPLPYSLSNGFLATVGSVRARSFALATAAATPKLLIHVFVGSRLALLAESGDKMTGFDRAINFVSMGLFGVLGFCVGLLIYRRTMARAAELAREAELEAGDALLDGSSNPAEGDDEDLEQGVMLGDDDLENGRMVHPDELDAAALMEDDDISLWDTAGDGGYRDSWDDGAAVGQGAGAKGVGANGH
ncbi:uncharacterized protein THITE_2113810 [Thermothielavioides terrestris NRRL 8126]|uniref:Golgi apparatus membrane protein TVP38 n=1 Tax=Thermothielavioides terrestris (strain ATCC 38088 / NRRL 8126) TaxID=578455 RepID=G2R491_THETT|nr:uncharacterized protein THITE_2113810 [Thermothielavioides terrestris NRRL 8126]AEO66038.1 hypothetical protein THITE_2113810 [Thermothielavioides terrestris NRRL 8126]